MESLIWEDIDVNCEESESVDSVLILRSVILRKIRSNFVVK